VLCEIVSLDTAILSRSLSLYVGEAMYESGLRVSGLELVDQSFIEDGVPPWVISRL
jgi:hypothetical protein